MGSIFGGDTEKIANPDYSELDPLTEKMYAQMDNDPTLHPDRQTAGQKQFAYMAQQGLENTLQGQAAQRGIRASQLATMGNNALANQQSTLSGQAAVRDAMERDAAQNSLAGIMMQKQAQQIAVNQANAQIEQQNKSAQDRMIGMGLSAAGMAFGGPAAGMAAGGLASGLGGGQAAAAPTNMGANPYAGAASSSGSMQYDPNRYSMGSALKYSGSF